MTSPTRPLQNPFILESIACTFIDIHLDEVAKRDLAIWFAEHPDGHYAGYELCQCLNHPRSTLDRGLRSLQEAGAIVLLHDQNRPAWQLTTDSATRQILKAVAGYFSRHPEMRTVIPRHRSV